MNNEREKEMCKYCNIIDKADKKLKESDGSDSTFYSMVWIPTMTLMSISIFLVFRHDNPTFIDTVPLIIGAIYWTYMFHKYGFE